MLEFLLKRLATIVPTLVFVSMLIFGLQQLLPGDPAKILAGEDQDPSVVAHLRAKLHLDYVESELGRSAWFADLRPEARMEERRAVSAPPAPQPHRGHGQTSRQNRSR